MEALELQNIDKENPPPLDDSFAFLNSLGDPAQPHCLFVNTSLQQFSNGEREEPDTVGPQMCQLKQETKRFFAHREGVQKWFTNGVLGR